MIHTIDPTKDFFFIAGPCLVEGEEMMGRVAEHLSSIARRLNVQLILKGSFKKANRTSLHSTVTIGEEAALKILAEAGRTYSLPTLTDIHTEEDALNAAKYVDVLQIPAFLSRQTDLLLAAGQTGKAVNIKKGQFMAPEDIGYAVEKVQSVSGGGDVMVCERGVSFGYHNLVVDMRGLIRMRQFGVPVIFDATHSTQQPSLGTSSGGERQFALPLARAATAVGVNALFFETHPDPANALSDGATQIPLDEAAEFMRQVVLFHQLQSELAGEHGVSH
ncbi:MAG: 3-deoxy-8-phosphooctulonate synthase [Ignavibacteriae bacterium]|nr:3-deoxy-8-phosphooctulonate synthase [Ignavibacteriota bacterium]MCB9216882.1 3-deoxy-8-phosphooctulonate synthase [Ignavibacteria bacterium]